MSDYIDIFQETSCPSMEVLDHYLSQDLSAAEQQKIEAHLVDCPLCNDAIEGLSMVQDKKALKSRIKRIKQLNEQRLFTVVEKRRETLSKRQSRVKPMKIAEIIVASAASVAILLATIFVIFQIKKSEPAQIAQNETSQLENNTIPPAIPLDSNTADQIAEALLMADSLRSQAIEQEILAQENTVIPRREKKKISNSSTQTPFPPKVVKNSSATTNPKAQPQPTITPTQQVAIAKEEESASETISQVDTALFANDLLQDENTKVPVEREDISLRVEEKSKKDPTVLSSPSRPSNNSAMLKNESYDTQRRTPIFADDQTNESKKYGEQTRYEVLNQLMDEGKSYYRQERFQEAENRFKEVLQSDIKNTEAQLHLGMTQFKLNFYKEAQKSLRKIENDETFGEEAKWQLVKVYTKLTKEERVKKLLNEIISLKGKYAEEAKKLLDSLEEEN